MDRLLEPPEKLWWTKKPKFMKRVKKGNTYRYHFFYDPDSPCAERRVFGDIHPGVKMDCPVCLRESIRKKGADAKSHPDVNFS